MAQVNYIKVGGYVYSENDCIGKGSFGKVYKGKSLATGAIVAIKIIFVENAKQTTLIKMIKNEVDALKKVKNENIVEFFEFTVMNNHVYIITELCNQRDLKYYLTKYKILGEKKVVEFLRQILNAFKEMCAKKVFHRDLKPANVLLHNGVCKIADFGFAKRLDFDVTDYNAQMVSVVGTPLYMAPQLLDKQKYSTKSDIWSIGIITYEMLFGKAPWVGNDPVTYSKNIKNQPLMIDRTINYISGEAEDFLRQCLQVTEEDRIGWEELFKHPFIYDGPQSDTSTQEDSKDEDLLGEINPEKMVKAHCRGPINPSNLMKLYQQKTLGASRDILNSNVEPTKTTIDQKLKNINQLIVSQSILGKGMPLTPITPLNKSLNFSMGDEMNKTLTNIKSNNENLVHMNRFKSNILSNSREISHSPDIMNTNLSKKVSDEVHEEFKKIENPLLILKNKIEIFIDLHKIIYESEEFKDVPVIKFNLLLTLSKFVNMVFKEFSSQVLTKKIKTRSNLLAEYVESDSFKRLLVFAETEKKGVDDMIKNCSRRMFELPLGSDKEKDELLEYYHETCNEVEEIVVLGKIIDISNQMLYQLRFNSQIFRKSGANLEASKNNKLSSNKKYLEDLLAFLGDDNIIDLFKYDKINEIKYKLDKLKNEASQK